MNDKHRMRPPSLAALAAALMPHVSMSRRSACDTCRGYDQTGFGKTRPFPKGIGGRSSHLYHIDWPRRDK